MNSTSATTSDSARDLTARLHDLLRRERIALADFVLALAEFDRRRLWLELGHASLFYFLHRELGLSKGAAFYRKTAAELVQRFPEVIEPLREGRLCLTSVVELSKVLTPENREEVLPRFFQLSKREAKAVTAELLPDEAAPRREVVTVVRGPAALALTVHLANQQGTGRDPAVHPANQPGEAPAAPCSPPSVPPPAVDPLSADLRRLHVTVSRRFIEKLEAARAALSHSHPGAGAQEILEAGLDLLLERHARRRGLSKKPRREPRPSKPDRVPAHVSRAVWERDQGRCQFPLASGGICGSTHRLQLDHVVPRARGGPSTVENLRVACSVHNQHAARQAFGDAWMDRYTRKRRAPDGRGAAIAPSPP
jgi:5-methylcytosine-specific restriction endonuclease McrA